MALELWPQKRRHLVHRGREDAWHKNGGDKGRNKVCVGEVKRSAKGHVLRNPRIQPGKEGRLHLNLIALRVSAKEGKKSQEIEKYFFSRKCLKFPEAHQKYVMKKHQHEWKLMICCKFSDLKHNFSFAKH